MMRRAARSMLLERLGAAAVGWAPLAVAVVYYAAAEAAFAVGTLTQMFAPFWPPNVVLLCTFLRVAERRWWIYVAAVLPAHLLAEYSVAMPIGQAMLAFASNIAFATLAAAALLRVHAGAPRLDDLRGLVTYLVITVVAAPALVALVAGFEPVLGDGDLGEYGTYWARWYLSNALGGLTLTPFILTWFFTGSALEALRRRSIEAAALTLGLAATCLVAFGFRPDPGAADHFLPVLLYVPMPMLLWAAVRFGAKGAAGAVLVVTVLALWQGMQGDGPFVSDSPQRGVMPLQLFLAVMAAPILLLGALVEQLQQTHARLSHSEAQFRAMAETVPDILFTSSPESGCEYMSPRFYEHTGITPEAARGFGWIDAVAAEDRDRLLAARDSGTRTGESFEEECRLRAADGSHRWFLFRWSPLHDTGGRARRWFGTISDIDDMKTAADALRELTARLLSAQDAERRRIARDLHDSTAQNLLGAALLIERSLRGARDDTQPLLHEARDLIELSQRELRTYSYLLHPPMLDESGLPSALRWFADGFRKRSGIAVALEIAPAAAERRFGFEVEVALFRVVQEALTNIHRHSGSDTAAIRLDLAPEPAGGRTLVLEVADAGRGMPAKAATRPGAGAGVGLTGMRERVGQIGGALSVTSTGAGTTIRVTVGLPEGPVSRSPDGDAASATATTGDLVEDFERGRHAALRSPAAGA